MSLILDGVDTFVVDGDDRPTDVAIDQAVLHQDTTYLAKFAKGFPDLAILGSDSFTITMVGAVSAGMSLSLRLIADDWAPSQVNGTITPALTGTAVLTGALGALAAGDTVTFDIATLMQSVSDGTVAWRGVAIERLDAGAAASIWTFEAVDPAVRPVQAPTYVVDLPVPTSLSPSGGRAVSVTQPTLRVLDYTADLDDIVLESMQVQWSASSSFSGSLLADDTLSVTTPDFDMTQAASNFALSNTVRYWRTRLKPIGGDWSPWSAPASCRYVAVGNLVFTFPPAGPGNVSEDPDPLDQWDFDGTQTVYQLTRASLAAPTLALNHDNAKPVASAVQAAYAQYEIRDYNPVVDTLKVWDDVVREDIPGAPAYAIASRTWSVVDDRMIEAPTMGTLRLLADGSPFVVVPWTSPNIGDVFRLRVNGVNVSGALNGADWVVGGGGESDYQFQYIWFGAQPNTLYEAVRVQRVTDHRGSAESEVQSIYTYTVGTYLANQKTGDWFELFDADWGAWRRPEPGTAWYGTTDSSAFWRKSRRNRMGYMTRIAGDLWPDDADDVTVNRQQRSLDSMCNSDDDLIFVTPHEAVTVQIAETDSTPLDDPFERPRRVAFDMRQTGESTLVTAPEPGQGETVVIDFESYQDGDAITTADPSGIIVNVVGDVLASADAAMHESGMGATFGNTTGGCYVDVTINPLASTLSYSSKGISAQPSGDKNLFRWAHTGTAIAAVRVGSGGAVRIVDSTGTSVGKTTVKIPANTPFRVQGSLLWFNGQAFVAVRLFIGFNTDGDRPDSEFAVVIPSPTAPSATARIGALSTPDYVMQVDDIQVMNNTGRWPENLGDPGSAFIHLTTLMGFPTFNGNEVASFVAGRDELGLAYSTDPAMATPTLVSAVPVVDTGAGFGVARHTLTGLTGNTRYYIQPTTDSGTLLFGNICTFLTAPATNAMSRKIVVTSCQANSGIASEKWDRSQPTFQKMIDEGFDLLVHQGDFGYWGGGFSGKEDWGKHVKKYVDKLMSVDLMRQVFESAGSIIQLSDHETSANNGENWEFYVPPPGGPDWAAITRTALDAYKIMMPVAQYGDTRTPYKGRWYAVNISPNVRLISLDLRSWERTLQTAEDGPSKKMLGDAQLAWLTTELRRPEPLKIISSDDAWGPAASVADFKAYVDTDTRIPMETAVTNKALTSNVATLTVNPAPGEAGHGLRVGDVVRVSGVDATFDGTYTVTGVPSGTQFRYAKTHADVGSTAATGTVFSQRGGGDATDYNREQPYIEKWWSYQNTQKQVANLICNPSTGVHLLTTIGTPINVDFWGGDRHMIGYLSEANNVLADGTKCGFPVLTTSGSDRNGLPVVLGETYDQLYGALPLGTAPGGFPTEVRQFMHVLLTDDGAGTITRVAHGWNCAPDPEIIGTQPYAPALVIDATDVWTY